MVEDFRIQSTADRLSKQLDTAKRRMSTAPRETIIKYADTSSDILKECITEYQTMAEAADGHAVDIERLSEDGLNSSCLLYNKCGTVVE